MSSSDYSFKRKGRTDWESDKELRQYRTKQAIKTDTGKQVREVLKMNIKNLNSDSLDRSQDDH